MNPECGKGPEAKLFVEVWGYFIPKWGATFLGSFWLNLVKRPLNQGLVGVKMGTVIESGLGSR